MKKILFVINTLGCAGAEVALMAMLENLDPKEFEVSLFVLMNQGEMKKRIPKHVCFLNKEYSECPIHSEQGKKQLRKHVLKTVLRHGSGVKNIPYFLGNLGRMVKKGEILSEKLLWKMMSDGAMRIEEHFDMAVAYIEGGSAYYVADHVHADKKVGFIHIDYKKAGYSRKLDRNCYQSYQKIFAVSDEVKEHFLEVYPEYQNKTEVFHNMIDKNGILKKSKGEGGFTDDFQGIRLLTVGRLTQQKAYETAIDAMKLLKEKTDRKVRWYVIGEGELRKELEAQIKRNGLEKDFILLGAKENPYPYFAQTDLYVHATRFEGKSIAIQEAQILGCCLLVSDCSGNREQIIPGVDGSMCELTPEGICDGLFELIQNEKKREEYQKKTREKKIADAKELEKLYALFSEDRKGECVELRESTVWLDNPRRGWYQIFTFYAEREFHPEEIALCFSEHETIALVRIGIGAYRGKDLDDAAIKNIRAILTCFTEKKIDMILRICYDLDGKGMEQEPSLFSQVERHAGQIAELIKEYRDSIFVYQGILVGSWGEMHDSKFLTKEKIKTLSDLLKSGMGNRTYLALRKPSHFRMLKEENNVIRTEKGYQITEAKKDGLFDDAVFGSETHLGTFGSDKRETAGFDQSWSREEELEFIDALTRQVPNGGEAVYGEEFLKTHSLKEMVNDLNKMHMTYFNRLHDSRILEYWKNQVWESEDVWNQVSGYDYIGCHLGYRFCVRKADMSGFFDGNADFHVEIENTGFAPIYEEVEILLEQGAKKEQLLCKRGPETNRWIIVDKRIPVEEGAYYLRMRTAKTKVYLGFANEGEDVTRVFVTVQPAPIRKTHL